MPKEPIDPAEQSLGDGFQKLVQPKSKTPSGVWVIVGLAIFFALIAFGIAGFIVYEAVMAKRHAGEASPVVASATPSTSARTSPTAAITATPKKEQNGGRRGKRHAGYGALTGCNCELIGGKLGRQGGGRHAQGSAYAG